MKYRRVGETHEEGPSVEDALLQKRLHFLLRRIKQVQRLWRIIDDGDRVLLGLSGGKDSMALLYLLRYWRKFSPERFEFAALHVEFTGIEGNAGKRILLSDHSRRFGASLDFAEIAFPETGEVSRPGFRCFRCSRARREALFSYAFNNGFNKVALAHHLDDAVETALMNLLYHSNLETMEPKVTFFDGCLTLIRPLLLAPEKELLRVSSLLGFPFFNCLCAQKDTTGRDKIREFIRSFGREAEAVKRNIWSATRIWLGE
jgi:tRNA 2-thiocytidine biosynthesis protein TtcA